MRFLSILFTLFQALLALADDDHLQNAVHGAQSLQNWYNATTGLWQKSGWWNSANLVDILAELALIDHSSSRNLTNGIFSNTFVNAQRLNLNQTLKTNDTCKTSSCLESEPVLQPKGFFNEFYDDGGWWAHAWIKVYDLTGQNVYLDAATHIFDDMVATGYNATCGGLWWKRDKKDNNAIENELFLSLAAHLATRKPNKEYYRNWALRHWSWFESTGMINQDWLVNDGLDLATCKNNNKTIWTYNQGVIIRGLLELNRLAPNNTFLEIANKIAKAAISRLSDSAGILHDQSEVNGSEDVPTFKGVFMRHLKGLVDVTKDKTYSDFILKNANSIWSNNRNQTNNQLGPVWSGPLYENVTNAVTQGAALDAIVAAAAIQRNEQS